MGCSAAARLKAAVVTLDKASFQYKGKPLLSFPDSFKMQNLTRTVSDN